MKVTVVGCSPAWPNPGGAHSGYLLEAGGARLLLDCGPGVLSRLREREGWPRIDAIAITHMHPDHSGDLAPWLWGHLTGPARALAAPDLWLPPGGRGELPRYSTRFDDAFTVREYPAEGTFAAAGFEVTPYAMRHYDEPTFGLRVERDGTVVAYSADTGPTPALATLARDADLFLCEATLDADGEHEPRGHLTAREAADAAHAAGAKRLLLVHRAVELPAEGLSLAHEGLELDLESEARAA